MIVPSLKELSGKVYVGGLDYEKPRPSIPKELTEYLIHQHKNIEKADHTKLFKYWYGGRKVVHLNLEGWKLLGDVHSIGCFSVRLKKLSLTHIRSLSNENIFSIISKTRCLVHLNLSYTNVNLDTEEEFLKFYQLKFLDLTGCNRLLCGGLKKLLRATPKLETLLLRRVCRSFSDFSDWWPRSLKHISLSDNSSLSNQGVGIVLQDCRRLQVLDISRTNITFKGLMNIRHQDLGILVIAECHNIGLKELFRIIKVYEGLNTIRLSKTRKVDREILQADLATISWGKGRNWVEGIQEALA